MREQPIESELELDSSGKRARKRCGECLRKVSIVKYQTPLYFNNWDYYSTKISGIVTLLIVTLILIYAVIVFKSIFSYENYVFDQVGKSIEHYAIEGRSPNEHFVLNCTKGEKCMQFTI